MRIQRRDGESIEQLLRRFNKQVMADKITKTYREKQFFTPKSTLRNEKRRRAERKRRREINE